MSTRIGWLAGLLAVQLIVTGAFMYVDVRGAESAPTAFLDVSMDGLDRLIVSGEDTTLEFARSGDDWSFASGVPADAEKIREVVDKLTAVDPGWPVARTEDSQERFRVTAGDHERRVVFFAGEEPLAEIYLGTSPGFRRIHARRADSGDVYSIDFAVYELPLSDSDWLDKALLRAQGEVSALVREEHWSLRRDEGAWRLTTVAPAQEPGTLIDADQDAATRLIERVANLRVTGFAPEGVAFEAAAVFTVTDASGSYGLRIFSDPERDEYAVESDRQPGLLPGLLPGISPGLPPGLPPGRFGLAAYVAEQLIVAVEDLRAVEPEDSAAAAEADAPAASGPG